MYRLQKAKLDLRTAQQKLAAREGQRDLLRKQKTEAEARKLKADELLGTLDLVQILFQKTSDYARQRIKGRIEEIVSQALNVVFGGQHRFIIEMVVRSNRPEADYFLDDGNTLTQLKPPDYDRGGGKIDVVSMGLKIAVAELEGIEGPLFLDEIGKHVSQEYAPNVAYFLKEYGRQFNRQMILITHQAALAEIGDVSLEVRQGAGGKSEVKAV